MGTQIFGGLGPGLGLDINPFDPEYQTKLLRAANQAQADQANARAVQVYQNSAANAKAQNNAAGKVIATLPPPPHKKILDSLGNIIDSTELVCEPISVAPDAPTAPPSSPTGVFPNSSAPFATQQLDQILAMLRVLKSDLDAIKAKLGL